MFWSRYWWNNSENGLVRGNGDYFGKMGDQDPTQKKRERQFFRMLLNHSRTEKAEHDLADADMYRSRCRCSGTDYRRGNCKWQRANLGWEYKNVKKEMEELTGPDVEVRK